MGCPKSSNVVVWACGAFLREDEHVAPSYHRHILEVLDDPLSVLSELDLLQQRMIFSCYELLSALSPCSSCGVMISEAKSCERAGGNVPLYKQLVAHGKACITSGFRIYQQKFSGEFHTTVRAFRAARLYCPVSIIVQEAQPTAALAEELKLFPFLNNDATIPGLVRELPLYLAIADGAVVSPVVRW